MKYKAYLIFVSLFFAPLFFLPLFIFANDSLIGHSAPYFKIISGNKEVLTSDDIRDKVTVLFYEAKSAIEQNRKLKNELNNFYSEQLDYIKRDIVRIGVIDCYGVLFRGAWESGIKDNSVKEGITIYGDWDGKMANAYHVQKGESNVVIIDKKGIIRYYASGQIKNKDIGKIERLLIILVEEEEK